MDMKKNNQKSKKILVISIITVIFALLGGTFAWWTWNSSTNTTVTFTVTSSFSCSVDGGGDITDQDTFIAPTDECTNPENAIIRKITTDVTNSGLNDITMDLWLDVKEMGTGLSDSQNFKYVLTTSPTSCTTDKVTSGTFNGKVKDSKVNLLDGITFSGNSTNEYYLYIWLDSAETSASTMNQLFELSLNGSCTNSVSIITFYYKGTQYQAEEGMTWEEFIKSSYNKDGDFQNMDNLLIRDGQYVVERDDENHCEIAISEEIKADAHYTYGDFIPF